MDTSCKTSNHTALAELEKDLERDIEKFLYKIFREYHSLLPEELKTNIKKDVIECSAFEDGYYNDLDIQLAFEREILSKYGIC